MTHSLCHTRRLMAEHGIDWRTDPAKLERTRIAFLTDIKKEILCT